MKNMARVLVSVFLLVVLVPGVLAEESCTVTRAWEGLSNSTAAGFAIHPSGNVYVTDRANHRILMFSETGGFIGAWEREMPDGIMFHTPRGIAIDLSGYVYITDSQNNTIERAGWSSGFSTWGSEGTGNREFDAPTGIAVDRAGTVYVADTGNDRIQVFHSTGQYLATWGSSGSLNGHFIAPEGIAIDSSGTMYVADTGNHRVQKISPAGTVLATWGSEGAGNGQFSAPSSIALDYWGNVYVSDGTTRIQKFSPAGEFLSSCEHDGKIIALATDSSGTVYVLRQSGTRWMIGQLVPRSPTYVTATTPGVSTTFSAFAERTRPPATPTPGLTTPPAITAIPAPDATLFPAPAASGNATMAAPTVEETIRHPGFQENPLDAIIGIFRGLLGWK